MVTTDTHALDHLPGAAIGQHGPGTPNGLLPFAYMEYDRHTGRKVIEDDAESESCHRTILSTGLCGVESAGGETDKDTGKSITFARFPWRRTRGDACIVRPLAIVDPSGKYRIEMGRG